jgi:hypothetical protein
MLFWHPFCLLLSCSHGKQRKKQDVQISIKSTCIIKAKSFFFLQKVSITILSYDNFVAVNILGKKKFAKRTKMASLELLFFFAIIVHN